MSELICEFAPIAVADTDYNPSRLRSIIMKPDCRGSRATIVNSEFVRLLIGPQTETSQTGLPCPRNDTHG